MRPIFHATAARWAHINALENAMVVSIITAVEARVLSSVPSPPG